MFLITQFIGIFVIQSNVVPSYLDSGISEDDQGAGYYFFQLIISFTMAVMLFVLITRYKLVIFMKIWFLFVLIIALSISFSAIIALFGLTNYLIALTLAIVFGLLKVFRPSIIIHNATELLIYPGIATIFVPILTPFYVLFLLVLISIYDMWAVWHSGIMQKMAKFQMEEMKIFGGFMIPYLTKEVRQKIKLLKQKYKNKKPKNPKGLKIPIAILGGGDVVFPIITAGVFLNAYGIVPALYVIFGALAGLTYLMITGEKKPYPAMPYISVGIGLGLLVWFLLGIL